MRSSTGLRRYVGLVTPARIGATGELAARDLEWAMRHSLRDMVSSAWAARRAAGVDYPH